MPMVKAVVKAMDAVQAFSQTLEGPSVERFVVAGASKRGWTTWLTGAVDSRVAAIVPMVMPILNIMPNMNHHFQAYNGWSFALSDYIEEDIMAYMYSPCMHAHAHARTRTRTRTCAHTR
jgi:PhoPQ-activated pathogenicity-related protein